MNTENDDVLDALRAELAAVEPSPRFAAGVRQRIEARVQRPALWLAAAASVGFATWATVAMPVKPEVATSPMASVSEVFAPIISPATSPVPGNAKPRRALAPSRTREPLATLAASEPRLEVLVPPDQAIAVRRLLIMHGVGRRFAVAPDGHAVDELTGALLDLAPIQIPQVTIELLPGPEPGVGGKIK